MEETYEYKSGLLILGCVLSLFIGLIVFSETHKEKRIGDYEAKRIWPTEASLYVSGVRTSIIRTFLSNGIDTTNLSLAEIEKLNFSTSFEDSIDRPEWYVFHLNDGYAQLWRFNAEGMRSEEDNNSFIFTIANSLEGAGTDDADLLAVLELDNKKFCEMTVYYNASPPESRPKTMTREEAEKIYSQQVIQELEKSPWLLWSPKKAPKNSSAILPALKNSDGELLPYGCVFSNGKYYYYELLIAL